MEFSAGAVVVLFFLLINAALVAAGIAWALIFHMPGKSRSGRLPPLSPREAALSDELRRDVQKLAGDIGERNIEQKFDRLIEAAEWIEAELRAAGFQPWREEFEADGQTVWNVVAEAPGSPQCRELVVVGAHYDTVPESPGANDNASAVAGALALARVTLGRERWRTVRFVFFVNEEQPYSHTLQMGSYVHALGCQTRGESILAMICLETIGYYSSEPGSQNYPRPLNRFFPETGNFVAFVGNLPSRSLVRRMVRVFREKATLPSEGIAAPASLVPDVGRSDHRSFWRVGCPAVMVTDTANFRYRHYHEPADTPDQLRYDAMGRLMAGLELLLRDLSEL
jgi:hypothetical protein